MNDVVIVGKSRQRWLAWRDLVVLLLGVAIVLLVRQVGDLRDQLDRNSKDRAKQIAALNDRIDEQNALIDRLTKQDAAKDARIRQLTDQLLEHGITPEPAPVVSPSPFAPSPTPGPRPSRSRHPSPSHSATPSCAALCITPLPTPAPMA